MKLILNMYDHDWVMHMTFHQGVLSYRRDLPFDYLYFNDFSVVFPNFVSNGWNLMKLTLNIYDHFVDMHVKCHQGVINYILIPYILMLFFILNLVSNPTEPLITW